MHTFIPLDLLIVEELGPDDVKKEPELCIKISPNPNGKGEILFKKKLPFRIWRFSSIIEKTSWVKEIKYCIEHLKK